MKKADDIKEHMVETTKSLLRKNAHVTIQDIAKASYVNIAAVNYHFGSKDKLIERVVKETLDRFKTTICDIIDALPENSDIEEAFSHIIRVIYTFALENIGIVGHIFWHHGADKQASNLFAQTFFETNPFTQMVFDKIAGAIKDPDPTVIAAKYTLLFSSLSLPIFMHVMQSGNREQHMRSLRDEAFKKVYIQELLRIVQ